MRTSLKFLSLFFVIAVVPLLANSQKFSFSPMQELELDYTARKACWNELDNTIYIQELDNSQIHIYHFKKKINSFNCSDLNIKKFADITLAPDGNLFILDSFQNKIISIDKKGKKLSELMLSSAIEPLLFCVSRDDKFYIYDDNSQEIKVVSYNGEIEISFGGMQITEPQKLEINEQSISVYCADDNTYFFSKLGQFLEVAEGNCYKASGKLLKLNKFYITDDVNQNKLAVNIEPWQEYYFESPKFILIQKGKIITGNLKYEK